MRAGNTPASVENIQLTSRSDLISAAFQLLDEESDPVTLESAEISLDGAKSFTGLSGEVWGKLPKGFASALGPEGAHGSLVFSVRDLTEPALRPMSEPGFKGDVCVRFSFRDYPAEAVSGAAPCFTFDNSNDPRP